MPSRKVRRRACEGHWPCATELPPLDPGPPGVEPLQRPPRPAPLVQFHPLFFEQIVGHRCAISIWAINMEAHLYATRLQGPFNALPYRLASQDDAVAQPPDRPSRIVALQLIVKVGWASLGLSLPLEMGQHAGSSLAAAPEALPSYFFQISANRRQPISDAHDCFAKLKGRHLQALRPPVDLIGIDLTVFRDARRGRIYRHEAGLFRSHAIHADELST